MDPNKIEYELEINAWIKFFGIWMAEGCAYNKCNICYVNVSAHKDRVKNILDEIEQILNWKWSKNNDNTKNKCT